MQPDDLLYEMQAIFPENIFGQVLKSLRQDSLVWECLKDRDVFQTLCKKTEANIEAGEISWTPAQIALIVMGMDVSPDDLATEPMQPIEESQRQRALGAYEDFLVNQSIPANLAEAGWLALALRERRLLTGTWDGFAREIFRDSTEKINSLTSHWQTLLGVLYGLLPDPQEMLRTLVNERSIWPVYALVSHVLLANTWQPDLQKRLLQELMEKLPASQQLEWLRGLNQNGWEKLVQPVATSFIAKFNQITTGPHKKTWVKGMSVDRLVNRALEMQQLAQFYRLAKQNNRSLESLFDAQESMRKILAGMEISYAETAQDAGDQDAALANVDQLLKLQDHSTALEDELAVVLNNSSQSKSLLGQLYLDQAHPLALIKKAGLLEDNGDHEEAVLLAKNAVICLAETVAEDNQSLLLKQAVSWNPVEVLQVLVDLGLYQEALQVGLLILKERSSDISLIHQVSLVLKELGDSTQAKTYAHMAVALDPTSIESRRNLATLYEHTEDFIRGSQEWERIAATANQPSEKDWLGIARTSYKLSKFERSLEACNRVIMQNPVNNEATLILGQALMKLNRYGEAAAHLSQAVLMDPSYSETWLALVQCYKENEQPARAMETLRSAVMALPGSADINFAMADAYLATGALTEGLPFLRKAASQAPESIECSLRLADTLVALGKLSEACGVIENARKRWNLDTRLAQLHAQILISLGNPEAAIPALEVALKTPVPDFGLYFLHGKTLLGSENVFLNSNSNLDYARIINAQQSLEKALILQPRDFEARLLMAEVLGARGVYLNAFNVYRRLSEELDDNELVEKWRVAGGLGLSALKLNQVETSLAALREAVEENTGNVFLQRALAEASLTASLKTEAMDAANIALSLAPDNIENLTWFANFAISMGNREEAVSALQCATQLAPDQPDFWIQLAELQLQMGDQVSGKTTLQKLLVTEPGDLDQLQRAAGAFIKMNDFQAANDYLERAAQEKGLINPDLNFILGCLSARIGDYQAALDRVQQAIADNPNDASLYTFTSDLYELLGRPQAALASLDHAAQAAQSSSASETTINRCARWAGDILPGSWMDALTLPTGITLRSVNLLCQLGDYLTACERIDTALAASPSDIDLQYWSADLNLALLRDERAVEILNLAADDDHVQFFEHPAGITGSRYSTWISINCLRAETMLDMDRYDQAKDMVASLTNLAADNPRVLALQVRLNGLQGEPKLAREKFAALKKLYLQSKIDEETMLPERESGNIFYAFLNRRDLWHVFAAQSARMWDDALEFAQFQEKANPHEPRTHLVHARIRVEQAEQVLFCTALRCKANSPEKTTGHTESEETFERSIKLAGSCGHSRPISHWLARGQLVFQPSGQTVRALLENRQNGSDVAALVLGLHRLENDSAAFQIAQKQMDDHQVLASAAICLMGKEPEKAFELAEIVHKERPNDPLNYALMGLAAESNGNSALALEMVEQSLTLWPEEIDWHIWAADLSAKLNDPSAQISHLETAGKLDTGNMDIVIHLAEICLDQDLPEKAIQLMEAALRTAPENPKIWYLTGLGYLNNHQYKRAIECGERAAALDMQDPKPFALCGRAALAEKRFELAAAFVASGLLRDIKNIQLFLLQAELLSVQGKAREAVKVIDQALSGNPDQMDLLFERAKLIKNLDGAQAALPYAGEVVRLFPGEAQALTFLARIYHEIGNLAEAERVARQAYKISPDTPEVDLLLGKIQRENGQLDQAVSYFSHVIQSSPDILEAYLELGKTYHARREINNALHTLQTAVQIFGKDTRPYMATAQIYRDIKDYSNAETMLKKAASINPDDLSIRRQLSAMIALNLVNNSREVTTTL